VQRVSQPLVAGFRCRLDSADGFGVFRYGPRDTRGLAGYHFVGAPFWLLIVASGIPPGVWIVRRLARRRSRRAGLCPACGYDLRTTPDRCPECGTIVAR
jgi:hypothetical protein